MKAVEQVDVRDALTLAIAVRGPAGWRMTLGCWLMRIAGRVMGLRTQVNATAETEMTE